ncbi:unnamed protein product [Pneumocystis jirovecii]|uniref:Uncharacterized protein n=1 Tax=Pneumocystis jirovecii TaxID=42068 RepID=L0P7A3_PNEJI|nr:unnamed protein product [Pneumocystis jirovecii]
MNTIIFVSKIKPFNTVLLSKHNGTIALSAALSSQVFPSKPIALAFNSSSENSSPFLQYIASKLTTIFSSFLGIGGFSNRFNDSLNILHHEKHFSPTHFPILSHLLVLKLLVNLSSFSESTYTFIRDIPDGFFVLFNCTKLPESLRLDKNFVDRAERIGAKAGELGPLIEGFSTDLFKNSLYLRCKRSNGRAFLSIPSIKYEIKYLPFSSRKFAYSS